jgi:hypothetical protein
LGAAVSATTAAKEALVIINGMGLSPNESEALRVALEAFTGKLVNAGALGSSNDDEMRRLTYLDALVRIRCLLKAAP